MTNREYDQALVGLRAFLYGNKPREVKSEEDLLHKLNMVVPHLQTVIEANSDTLYGDRLIFRRHLDNVIVSGRIQRSSVDLSVNQHLQGKTISVVALVFMPRLGYDIKNLAVMAISDRAERTYCPFASIWPDPMMAQQVRGYDRLLNTGIAYLLKALGKSTPVPDAFYR